MIEVPFDPLELGRDVVTQCRCDADMMSADREVHASSFAIGAWPEMIGVWVVAGAIPGAGVGRPTASCAGIPGESAVTRGTSPRCAARRRFPARQVFRQSGCLIRGVWSPPLRRVA